MKKFTKSIAIIFIAYLALGYLFHLIIFPEQNPDIKNYFAPGDVFHSKLEGLKQTVIKQENGKVYCRIEVEPFAKGPPLHIHTGFDEIFIGGDKPISIMVGKEEKILLPGEELIIPKGTPHKPFNKTNSMATLMMEDEAAFPEKFAVYLSQIYAYMDESPSNMKMPKIVFQMAMFNQHFDSYLGEGPPVAVQKILYFTIVPAARLMGFKSYYKKYESKR